MHFLTQLSVGLSALTIAAALVFAALELQRMRMLLEKLGPILARRARLPDLDELHRGASGISHKVSHHDVRAGFAIYVFRDGKWHLEADLSAPGCESSPPVITGSFHGQVVRKESTLKRLS